MYICIYICIYMYIYIYILPHMWMHVDSYIHMCKLSGRRSPYFDRWQSAHTHYGAGTGGEHAERQTGMLIYVYTRMYACIC